MGMIGMLGVIIAITYTTMCAIIMTPQIISYAPFVLCLVVFLFLFDCLLLTKPHEEVI